ncbi:family 43 glycosylhydrolase [candidate division KSB1 bacterium]|nr:family 43 glycosylhydrolase [candidate division KSB1 bacterium]
MKGFQLITFVLFFFTIAFLFCQESPVLYHSFKPGQIWYDNNGIIINAHGGGIFNHLDTYYWFGEHKIAGPAGNKAQVGVHCYSSKDLYNWKDEGIVLHVVENDSSHDIAKGCILERPKVIYNRKTKKFVMWFHLELLGRDYRAARSGVAVSDNVTGPYKFLKSLRPNKDQWPQNVLDIHKKPVKEDVKKTAYSGGSLPGHTDSLNILGRDYPGGQMARDMTLFVDDDEKAYHIFASEENSTLHIAELSDDYLSHSGKYIRVFVGRFMEAPAVFKRQGKYYFIGSGCTGWAPNAARSSVAPSIWGPWRELGNPCIGPDSSLTFFSQSTFVLPVIGKKETFIFMADRWNPQNPIDGRYIWLPMKFQADRIILEWFDEWDLTFLDSKKE